MRLRPPSRPRTTATSEADALWDRTRALVWDIIMRPANRKLGLEYNPGRWITPYRQIRARGRKARSPSSQAVLTMTASVLEYPTSAVPVTGKAVDSVVATTADLSGANLDSASQGVKVGT